MKLYHYSLAMATALFFTVGMQAQTLLSSFTWETAPTTAAVGPNGTAVSAVATIGTGGVGGTRGLNAGTPKTAIDLIVPGSTFDVNGCDISVDFQREGNNGHFAYRGNSLRFGMSGGKVYVQWRVDNGMGGFKQYSQHSIYTIPHDDTYRTYRFTYKPSTGRAEVFVNGVSQWANLGSETPGSSMYWTGAGHMYIGQNMDGNASNKTMLDNWHFYELEPALLPIVLLDFDANLNDRKQVELTWETASEINNDFFTVERSLNGVTFEPIAEVRGSGTTNAAKWYTAIDTNPQSGTVYYRLSQTDYDGTTTLHKIVPVQIEKSSDGCVLKVYPNPCVSQCTVQLTDCEDPETADIQVQVYDATGNPVLHTLPASEVSGTLTYHMDTRNALAPGIYIVRAGNKSSQQTKTIVVQ